MDTDRKWIVVRIDGKIAAISTDYRLLLSISSRLAQDLKPKHNIITATAVAFEEVWALKQSVSWEDFMLFGTEFQVRVWKKLFELTNGKKGRLISYSDFAELCSNRAGVRAVAHAIGLNPIAVVIPCHLVIPKESIDKILEIKKKAETTIFKGEDLCLRSILKDNSIDFGNYSLGRKVKRELIRLEHEY